MCFSTPRIGPRTISASRARRRRRTTFTSRSRAANRYFQLERQSHRPPARSTVDVCEAADGHIEIRYRDRVMRYQELTAETRRATQTPTSAAAPPGAARPTPSPPRRLRSRQSADHPWRRQAIEDHYAYQQMAKDRRAWERVQP
jgi:hypothetical protein